MDGLVLGSVCDFDSEDIKTRQMALYKRRTWPSGSQRENRGVDRKWQWTTRGQWHWKKKQINKTRVLHGFKQISLLLVRFTESVNEYFEVITSSPATCLNGHRARRRSLIRLENRNRIKINNVLQTGLKMSFTYLMIRKSIRTKVQNSPLHVSLLMPSPPFS